MAPIAPLITENATEDGQRFGSWRDTTDPQVFIVESWSQGFVVGALLIMAIITIANMRRRVLLHKLILIEVRWIAFPIGQS